MTKTIEQQRAAHALEKIQKIQSGKKFTSIANGFPTMIHTNGLGQAIAFCMGKGEKQYDEIVGMLASWLCDTGKPFAGTESNEILQTITKQDMQTYMLAQAEAMAYLLWVKKFAKALIGDDDGTAPLH
jgi:CRISPR-associated protein Cmr5